VPMPRPLPPSLAHAAPDVPACLVFSRVRWRQVTLGFCCGVRATGWGFWVGRLCRSSRTSRTTRRPSKSRSTRASARWLPTTRSSATSSSCVLALPFPFSTSPATFTPSVRTFSGYKDEESRCMALSLVCASRYAAANRTEAEGPIAHHGQVRHRRQRHPACLRPRRGLRPGTEGCAAYPHHTHTTCSHINAHSKRTPRPWAILPGRTPISLTSLKQLFQCVLLPPPCAMGYPVRRSSN